jgi:hypothetical protein
MRIHTSKNETQDLHQKISSELLGRYGIDDRLANEMAWDFIEVITAVDGDLETLDKFILN